VYFSGLIIAVATFITIGIFASLFIANQIISPVLGVIGCSCLWSILELFEQKKRVERGWFPKNPKRKY